MIAAPSAAIPARTGHGLLSWAPRLLMGIFILGTFCSAPHTPVWMVGCEFLAAIVVVIRQSSQTES